MPKPRFLFRFFLFSGIYASASSAFLSSYVIYFIQHGFSFLEINLIDAAFLIAMFLFEIPTGVVADHYGRRLSFQLSCLIRALAMLIYFFALDFHVFVAGAMIAAIATTFQTGAHRAWFIDSLKEAFQQKDFEKDLAKLGMTENIFSIFGGMFGALIATTNIGYPWLLASSLFFLSGILSLSVSEQRVKRLSSSTKNQLQEFLHSIHTSGRLLFSHRGLLVISLFLAFSEFGLAAPGNFWQPYLIELSDLGTVWILGYVWVFMQISNIFGNLSVLYLKNIRINLKLFLTCALSSFAVLGMFFTKNYWIGFIIFLLHVFAEALKGPIINNYIHKNIPSSIRATAGSWISLITSFANAAALIFVGFLADLYSVNFTFLISAFVLFVSGLIVLLRVPSTPKE